MCRLLVIKSKEEFDIALHLQKFSQICKESEEYQGHGWGMFYLDGSDEWVEYKNIKPIWQDDISKFKRTKMLVAHARSAFQDKDIVVENNMPFFDGKYVFIFNGELTGVRISEEGRIGAEKIFNFIKRFDKGNMKVALETGMRLIKKRTSHYKAINVIISTKENIYLSNNFNERPNYFTLHYKEDADGLSICSMPFDESGWKEIDNYTNRDW